MASSGGSVRRDTRGWKQTWLLDRRVQQRSSSSLSGAGGSDADSSGSGSDDLNIGVSVMKLSVPASRCSFSTGGAREQLGGAVKPSAAIISAPSQSRGTERWNAPLSKNLRLLVKSQT